MYTCFYAHLLRLSSSLHAGSLLLQLSRGYSVFGCGSHRPLSCHLSTVPDDHSFVRIASEQSHTQRITHSYKAHENCAS